MAYDKKKTIKEAIGKVTMYDAERENSYGKGLDCGPCPPSSSYPCLYISGKEAPALDGKKVGDEFTMVVKAKVRGHSSRQTEGKEKCDDYDIELRSIGVAK